MNPPAIVWLSAADMMCVTWQARTKSWRESLLDTLAQELDTGTAAADGAAAGSPAPPAPDTGAGLMATLAPHNIQASLFKHQPYEERLILIKTYLLAHLLIHMEEYSTP